MADSPYYVPKMATFVGVLNMRSEYHVFCARNGQYRGDSFGHMNGAAAELILDTVLDLELIKPREGSSAPPAPKEAEQQCVQPQDLKKP